VYVECDDYVRLSSNQDWKAPVPPRISTEWSFRPIHTKHDKIYEANIQLIEILRIIGTRTNERSSGKSQHISYFPHIWKKQCFCKLL